MIMIDAITAKIGKIVARRIPVLIPTVSIDPEMSGMNAGRLPIEIPSDMSPISDGPAAQPRSPARAKSANIGVPPSGSISEPRVYDPGHRIATATPEIAQPRSESAGRGENAVRRYANMQSENDAARHFSIFKRTPYIPKSRRVVPIAIAKAHGPRMSPRAFATPRPRSAK